MAGDWNNAGVFVHGNQTVYFNGSGPQNITTGGTGDDKDFYSIYIQNTHGSPDDANDVDADAIKVNYRVRINDGQFQPATGSEFNDVSINVDGILKPDLAAIIFVADDWTGDGTFNHNNGSVEFNGASTTQNVRSESFYDVIIDKTGGSVILTGDVSVSNELNMTQGNIDANTNTFSLTNGTIASLDYTSGTIYDGEFQRNINSTGTYYFPVGISSDRNAITIDINTLTTAGSLSAEFVESDAGIDGLPLDDAGTSIVDYFTDGYWDMDARSGFATSDFDVTLEAESFNDYPIGTESRVLKRTNDGDWSLDGNHAPSIDPDINRNNLTAGISSSTTQFGIGLPNCIRFTTQPISITECLDENISFSVVVNSREGAASYQWQKNGFDIPGETAASFVNK